ncbi:MAG: hypothetical protein FJ296_06860, partial [Planctomycetes bacterium]|nr:hypothetical protein [Planctomycetota bacterium]
MRHPLRAAAGSLLLAAAAGAQSPDLSAQFATPPGTSVSLWAESPLFYNPTAIDIDPQGRVWITEAVNYRQWDGRNPGRHHDEGDRVVVVEDRDGDGRAETSTVFLQDKDLVSPLGICWLPDKVLVSCSPTVWAVYDDDGDLRADRKEVFLTGFGGFNHDHGAHSFSVGPDGRLHMALGNAGPHVVTDKSGWTLRSGSIYDDGGPAPAGNRPGLVSDDGRTYVGGLILRCNQDGTGLTVMAHNFRNPYEVAVDAFGDLWTFDNDDDGNQCCRVTWVMEGGNYGYFSADGSRYWQADRRPGQSVQTAHWHQDDPGVVPTTLITGSGGPTGVCVYEGEALPEPLRGALLCADAGRNCVYALRREADGAGFRLLPVEGAPPVNGLTPDGTQLSGILVSKPAQDGDETWRLFRPSDVCVAPDGSVLVADWFDPGVGGHMAGDRAAYGRLLRVAASGSPGRLEGTDAGRSSEARLEKLASPAQSVRAATFTQLMAAAWIPFDSLEAMQRDPALDPGVRARMAWFEARHRDVPTLNFPALQGRHPPREAAGPPDTAQDPAAALTWSDEQAALAWRLHPESLVPAFLARAQSPSLAHAARVQSLEALAFCRSREAAEAMLTLALAGPADTRELATWWVQHNDLYDWREYGLGRHVEAQREWTDDQIVWRSGPLTAGTANVDVDIGGSRFIALAVTPADNGNGHDWADWLDPVLEGGMPSGTEYPSSAKPLWTLSLADEPPAWTSASAEWGEVRLGRNCAGGPLRVGGVEHARGIG